MSRDQYIKLYGVGEATGVLGAAVTKGVTLTLGAALTDGVTLKVGDTSVAGETVVELSTGVGLTPV